MTQFHQHVIDDPAQQPQHPSVGQPPGHIPEHLFSFNQFSQQHHPKHQHTVPPRTDLMLTTMILLSKPLKRGREQSKVNGTIVNEPEVANVEKISDSERLSTEEKSEAIEEELKIQTEANDISKDSENNKEPVVNQPFIWKSEEIRFDDFPDKFDDWSEDQEKDAYSNNFKLCLQKYLKRTIKL